MIMFKLRTPPRSPHPIINVSFGMAGRLKGVGCRFNGVSEYSMSVPLLSLDNPTIIATENYDLDGSLQHAHFYEFRILDKLLKDAKDGVAKSPVTGMPFTVYDLRDVRVVRNESTRDFIRSVKDNKNAHLFHPNSVAERQQSKNFFELDPDQRFPRQRHFAEVHARGIFIDGMRIIEMDHDKGIYLQATNRRVI
jgi:hypothetical protein